MKELEKIAEWIFENYSSAEKIVEVGIGRTTTIIEKLRQKLPESELIATDVRKVPVPENVEFVLDDVTDPDPDPYRNADLIYSLRSPPEFHSSLLNLAEENGSDLLIKLVNSEEAPPRGRPVNYLGVSFYLKEIK